MPAMDAWRRRKHRKAFSSRVTTMQAPQRLKIRFGTSRTSRPVDLERVIPVFHDWIQQEKTPTVMIDVADYKHVPAGPGVMLVGHAEDLGLDNGTRADAECQGFYYVRKHGRLTDTQPLARRLQEIWTLSLTTGQLLEAEPDLDVTIDPCHIEISLLDRLLYPSAAANLDEVEGAVHSFFAQVLGKMQFSLERADGDPRESVSWRVQGAGALNLSDLAARVVA